MTREEAKQAARTELEAFTARAKALSEELKTKLGEIKKQNDEAKLKDLRSQLGL